MAPARRPPVAIAQQRVRRLHGHLLGVPRDAVLTPALVRPHLHGERLVAAGLSWVPGLGETVLPAILGPRSRFNADGGEAPRGTVGPRRPDGGRPGTAPPGLELQARLDGEGAPVVATEPLARGRDDERLLHGVNLLLELFGECALLREPLRPLPRAAVRRRNWEVLGPQADLRPALEGLAGAARRAAERRLATIEDLGADFAALGRAGYRGIVVAGVRGAGRLVVADVTRPGATRVTRIPWPELSRLGKGELLVTAGTGAPVPEGPGWARRVRAAAGAA